MTTVASGPDGRGFVGRPRSRCRSAAGCRAGPRRDRARSTRSSACWASAASPITWKSSASSRIRRVPARSSSWSSTTTTVRGGAAYRGRRRRAVSRRSPFGGNRHAGHPRSQPPPRARPAWRPPGRWSAGETRAGRSRCPVGSARPGRGSLPAERPGAHRARRRRRRPPRRRGDDERSQRQAAHPAPCDEQPPLPDTASRLTWS